MSQYIRISGLLLLFLTFGTQAQQGYEHEIKTLYEGKYVQLYYQAKSRVLQFDVEGKLSNRPENGPWLETSLLHILSIEFKPKSMVISAERVFASKDASGEKLSQLRPQEHVIFDIEIRTDKSTTKESLQSILDKIIRVRKDTLEELLTDALQWGKIPKKLRVSELALGPPLANPMPVYPDSARSSRKQGTVVVFVKIGTDGQVKQTRIVKSVDSELDQAALEAIRQWRFKPYLLDGEPVEIETQITINFRM